MEQGIINNIVSKEALDQLTQLEASLVKLEGLISNINEGKGAGKGSGGKQTDELAKSVQKVAELETKLNTLQANLDTALGKNVQNINNLRVSVNAITKDKKLEATATNQQVGAYERLAAEYQIAKKELLNLAAAGITSGKSFDDQKLKAANLEKKLNDLHRTTGQYGKGASNAYYSTFQLTQVMRELPNFAIDARIGFMSLSNNLPMLADGFRNLAKTVDATGKVIGNVGALKIMLKSLLSLNTVMIAGSTLLILFGDKLGGLFKKTNSAAEAQKAFNKSLEDGSSSYNDNIKSLYQANAAISAYKKGKLEETEALKKVNDAMGSTIGKFDSMQKAIEWQTANTKRYIDAMFAQAVANSYLETAVQKRVKSDRLAADDEVTNMQVVGKSFGLLFSQIGDALKNPFKFKLWDYVQMVKDMGNARALILQDRKRTATELYNASTEDRKKYEAELQKMFEGLNGITNKPIDKNSKAVQKVAESTKKWVAELIKADALIGNLEINTEDIFGKQTPETVYSQHKANLDAATKALKDANNEYLDELKAQKQAEEDIQREKEQLKYDIVRESITATMSLVDGITDYYLNSLDKEQEAYEKTQDAKLDALERRNKDGILSDAEYEAQKRAIEDETQKRQEEINKKQEEAEKRAFLLKQAAAIAEVWINYFINIAKIPALTPLYTTLAAISTAGIAAQSIPYFKEGGEMERDGMAMVGDGYKKEYVVTPRGQVYITPDIPTIVNMEKGSTIYPDASSFMNEYINKMYVDTSKIENKLDKIVYAINSQKQPEKKDRLIDYMKYHRMYGRDAKGN